MSETFLSSDVRSDEEFAVCIGKPDAPNYHMGIFYGTPSRAFLFDFAWYDILRFKEFDELYYCVKPDLGVSRLRGLRELCMQVREAQKTGIFPYGFSLIEQALDAETGACLCDNIGEGLTCATFICAIFARASVPLINLGTYQVEEDWQVFRDRIVKAMEDSKESCKIPEAHIERLRASTDVKRVRPEDVMLAVRTKSMPLAYEDAVALREIMKEEIEAALPDEAATH